MFYLYLFVHLHICTICNNAHKYLYYVSFYSIYKEMDTMDRVDQYSLIVEESVDDIIVRRVRSQNTHIDMSF